MPSPDPIPMVLHCPNCGHRHVDAPKGEWTNPPHRSHLCEGCRWVWRPADVCTCGVERLETRGAADSVPAAMDIDTVPVRVNSH